MSQIKVERDPGTERLRELGVHDWPIWTKEVSDFPWQYDGTETCYLLEGEVTVTPEDGPPVQIRKGDLVTFASGLSCRWEIHQAVRKHFTFDLE